MTDKLHEVAEKYDKKLTAAVLKALRSTIKSVAPRIFALTAATTPPGEPFVSLDDLGAVYSTWLTHVDELAAIALAAYEAGADTIPVAPTIVEMLTDHRDVAGEAYLAQAKNRLRRIGDDLWANTRTALLQGFQQGESIEELSTRVRDSIHSSEARATMIARTEVISASNGGAYQQATTLQRMGVGPQTKTWLATNDARTRPTHAAAEGQTVELTSTFDVGGAQLRYPGDPQGPPGEVINCRCTTLYDEVQMEVAAPAALAAALETDEEPAHTGSMIALVPSAADVDRLLLPNGEPADQLHLTMLFLGEATNWDPAQRENVVSLIRMGTGMPVSGNAFAAAMFNPTGDEPCWVLQVGGEDLTETQRTVSNLLEDIILPDQHTPWSPHVTLAYTDDPSLVTAVMDRVGPITFDRIRIAFGDEVHDVSLVGDDTVPDQELATQEVVVPWHVEENHGECGADKPWAVVKDDDGSVVGCHATEEEAEAQLAELYVNEGEGDGDDDEGLIEFAIEEDDLEAPIVETAPATNTAPVSGVLIVEETDSGDGRRFSAESLTWRELPLPLTWQVISDEMHKNSVLVGRIDSLARQENDIIFSGVLDLGGEHGRELFRLMGGQEDGTIDTSQAMIRGISADVDSVTENDVELVWPEEDPDAEPDMFMMPEKTIFHKGRIMGGTIVPHPAFQEAFVQLDGAPANNSETDALVASVAMNRFVRPPMRQPTAPTLTEDGHYYGHIAIKGTCHVGIQGQCVTPPMEKDMPYFATGEYLTSDGSHVAIGQITMGTGHANTSLAHRPAVEHYDHTGYAIADVAVGADKFGIWFSGQARPDVLADPDKMAALRAASLSGDWRRIGGKLRLVAVLCVNVPGFPVPRTASRLQSGVQTSLVAAGIIDRTEVDRRTSAGLDRVVEKLAADLGLDRKSQVASMVKDVHG